MKFIKQKLIILLVILIPNSSNAQYFKIFDIDTTNYPEIKAKYVAVDEKGRQIHNFKKNDIKLYENNEPVIINQHINSVKGTPQALSIVLTVDVSGSMNNKRMEIAKEASKTVIKLTPLEISEIAITSFDHKNYINQDFTKNATTLNNKIDSLIPLGGTDYNFGFTKPVAGALNVAKNGFYKRVVIFLTDGLSDGNTEEIIKYANDNKITIYCISVDMQMPEVLKNVSEKTGGRNFANVQSVTQANKVYTDILQIEQASTYGTISWTATEKKIPEITKLSVSATNNNNEILGTSEYITTENKTVRLKIKYETLNLGKILKIGDTTRTTIYITAKNADQTITKLECTNNHVFRLTTPNLPFVLKNNQTETIIIKYMPKDFGWISSKINIETQKGYKINLFASGGDPALPSKFDNNFKFTFPNTNSSLLANTDTSITWAGLNKSDTVNLFFSTNGGRDYTIIDRASNLSYKWQIPYNEINNCKFKLTKIIDLKENIILDTNYLERIKYSPRSKIFTLIDDKFEKLCLFNDQKQLIKLSQIDETQITPNNYFVSNTGKYIIFTDNNPQASLWDINNDKKISNIKEHNSKISKVVFSNDDSLFVSIANSKKTIVWKTINGQMLNIFDYEKRSTNIAISPNNKLIAVAYNDNNIIVWDIKTGKKISKLKKHNSYINILEFSSDNKTLLSASNDGLVILWDIKSKKKIKIFKHQKSVTNAFFASNEKKIISTSADQNAIIWDIENKKNHQIIDNGSFVLDAKLNPQEDKLLTLCKDKTAVLWEYPTGKYLKTIKLLTASSEKIIYFSKDEFVISNTNASYDLYNLYTPQFKDFYYTSEKAPGSLIKKFKNETAEIINVEFNKLSNRLLISTVDGIAKIKNLSGETLVKVEGMAGKILYSPDEKTIFAINKNKLTTWTSDGKFLYSLGGSLGHTQNITTAQFSPDSLIILTASQDGFIKLWNAKNSNHVTDIKIGLPIFFATYNNSGTKIIATTEKNIFIIDTKTKKILQKINTKNTQINIKITPDDDKIITTDNNITTIYKIKTGKKLHNFDGHFIDIIKGSNKFAIKNNETLTFIDYQTGGILYKIDKVFEVYDFSPDGNRYISEQAIGLVVCDINTGKMLYKLDFDLYNGTFSSDLEVFFSPDGNKILIVKNNNISICYAPQLLIAESEPFDIVAPKPQKNDVVFGNAIFINQKIRGNRKVLNNNTKYPIIINNVTIEGKNEDCFKLKKLFSKKIVQPNDSLVLEFEFFGKNWGEKSANIVISTPTDTLIASIRGTAVKETYEMINSEINFGKVEPLQYKDSTIIILKNTTSKDIEISEIKPIGADKNFYTININNKTIKKGENLSAKINFNPKKRGITNCNFQIYLKGYPIPLDFVASGEGDAPRIIEVSGKITNKDTHKHVEAKIYCYDYMTGNILKTTETDIFGKYNFEISVDREYVIIAEAPNYLPASNRINLTHLILEPNLECNIEISPVRKDGYSIIHSISFESGNTKLSNDIIVELDHFLKVLSNNKNIEIEISGHTDNVGSNEANNKISLERANSIKEHLISKGIDKSRLTTIGKGKSSPIAPNNTEIGRQQNRRVEIKIIKM